MHRMSLRLNGPNMTRSTKRTDFGRLLPTWNGKHWAVREMHLLGTAAADHQVRIATQVLMEAFGA
jgi:hypothetical protein